MITTEKAMKAIEASEKKAKELGIAVTTVVVDEHGTLIAARKMDGALLISPKFALAKAYTSANIQMPTTNLNDPSCPGKPYYGVTSVFGGKLTVIGGGIPVKMGNKCVGAVGVGGSYKIDEDVACAQAAAKAITE